MHRVVGRFYVAGVFLGAPLGFYIQYFEERLGGTRSFSVAALTDAALWMTTTAIALLFIFKGNVAQHRNWMTRSYAVAIVFLEVRFVGRLSRKVDRGPALRPDSEPAGLLTIVRVNVRETGRTARKSTNYFPPHARRFLWKLSATAR